MNEMALVASSTIVSSLKQTELLTEKRNINMICYGYNDNG